MVPRTRRHKKHNPFFKKLTMHSDSLRYLKICTDHAASPAITTSSAALLKLYWNALLVHESMTTLLNFDSSSMESKAWKFAGFD